MSTFTFGEVSITRVIEIPRSSYPTSSMLPESTPEAIARHHGWLKPDFFDESTGDLGSRIQTWVVRMPGRTILIDTGVGNGKTRHESALWHQRQGTWLEDLAAAGVTPGQVDTVVCTHLHVDHVGWNTRLEGEPLGADLPERSLRDSRRGVAVLEVGGRAGARAVRVHRRQRDACCGSGLRLIR